jgi:hypothetical protein
VNGETVRYIVSSGWVVSRSDGDRHFITAARLARLYGLRPGEWIAASDGRGRDTRGLVVLAPRYDGDYRRPLT